MGNIYVISDALGFSDFYTSQEAANEHMQIYEPEGGVWHVNVINPEANTIISYDVCPYSLNDGE